MRLVDFHVVVLRTREIKNINEFNLLIVYTAPIKPSGVIACNYSAISEVSTHGGHLDFISFYLYDRLSDRETHREIETERALLFAGSLPIAVTVRAGPGRSRRLVTPSRSPM